MTITKEQYEKIAHCLPKQRCNVKIENLTLINALLYICENGCKWRAIPSEFGNWHVIYMRLSRWLKNGVIESLFRELQSQQILKIDLKVVSMDSTTIKVHPDATGALKKTGSSQSGDQGVVIQQKFI